MSIVSRYKRRSLLDAARHDLECADRRLSDLLLSADTEYATQEPEWQEGEAGTRHCAASDKLRQAVITLRGLDLPDAGELG